MNRIQLFLAILYGLLTLLILLCHLIFGKGWPSLVLCFSIRFSMVVAAFLLPSALRERRRLRMAFLFTLVADFFFELMRLLDPAMPHRELYGMMGFLLAYFFLTESFSSQLRVTKREILTLIPFFSVFLLLFRSLSRYARGPMVGGGIAIGLMLSLTAMATVSTLYRGYFSEAAARLIAVAGSLMFCSDLLVAGSIYHPDFKAFRVWKENLIWGTYVPAWTLLLLLLAEDRPYGKVGIAGRGISNLPTTA